ncbi:MAG: ABC transporter permease, partial [Treponema sp.]|nr:ABC transporter permease [Treponema sp.]
MKTNSVLCRPFITAVLWSFLCGAGLCVPAFITGTSGLGDLFLAAPADIHAPEIDLQKIERFCDEHFPLTYEIPGPEKAVILGAEYPVTLIGTNSRYPRILGYSMADGSFFSKQAWKGGERHAVLNGKAAFDLFGSIRAAGNCVKIRNETWIVTGVINDGDDENRRIYVPSPARGGKAVSLLARTDAPGESSVSYLRDNLKSLGVYEGGFVFFDLGAEIRFFWERAVVALLLLSCLLPACIFPPALGKCRAAFFRLQRELKKRYLPELFCSGGLTPLDFLFSLLILPACAG